MSLSLLQRAPRAAVNAARYTLEAGSRRAAKAALSELGPLREPRSWSDHLQETVQWIFRAHDAADRKGVARSYTLRKNRRYGISGWLAAYPETTGYIIPTLYELGRTQHWPEATERAVQMAHWESDIQMEDGAVRGGTVADDPSPAVFNTGQVLFGWLIAARESGEERFLDSARRAAKYLVDAQDEDGSWRRGASKFAAASGHVYNARAAWALALYGVEHDDEPAREAAHRSARFALSHEKGNGWYAENCLDDQEHPLVHTIAYTAQGLLEMGLVLDESSYVDAARRTAIAVADAQQDDGYLAGRFDMHWSPSVAWSCLTGNAQMALVWDRLAALEKNPVFKEAADNAVRFDLSTQRLADADPGIRGGLAGSYPLWGDYGSFEFLNWAAKFLCDALITRVQGSPGGTLG